MKKLYPLLFCVLFFNLALFAQQVPEVQKSLITKRTADWCPLCGGWGWPLFEGLIADNDDQAILMATHFSGGLKNPTAEAIADNFGGFYQPVFFLNGVDQNATSSNANQKRAEIKAQVETNAIQAPLANTGIQANLQGGEILAVTKTKFFQAAEGDYYLGLYVVESFHSAYQAGQGNSALHKKLLRAAFTQDHFGELLASGSISAGSEFTGQYTVEIDPDWNENVLEIAAVVWRKQGGKYIYVNGYSIDEFGPISSTEESVLARASMDVVPNLARDIAKVTLRLEKSVKDVRIELIDLTGRSIQIVYEGDLEVGEQSWEVEKPSEIGSGLYLITLVAGGEKLIKKVVFQ